MNENIIMSGLSNSIIFIITSIELAHDDLKQQVHVEKTLKIW